MVYSRVSKPETMKDPQNRYTTEGATQNSLAGEHGDDDEVAANREMIG